MSFMELNLRMYKAAKDAAGTSEKSEEFREIQQQLKKRYTSPA